VARAWKIIGSKVVGNGTTHMSARTVDGYKHVISGIGNDHSFGDKAASNRVRTALPGSERSTVILSSVSSAPGGIVSSLEQLRMPVVI
jgi:hypothetical protein